MYIGELFLKNILLIDIDCNNQRKMHMNVHFSGHYFFVFSLFQQLDIFSWVGLVPYKYALSLKYFFIPAEERKKSSECA